MFCQNQHVKIFMAYLFGHQKCESGSVDRAENLKNINASNMSQYMSHVLQLGTKHFHTRYPILASHHPLKG
jgi:hypothetical protein